MGWLEVVGVGIGLSMDAMAVSIACGIGCRVGLLRLACRLGLAFGFFQAFMPLLGYLLGRQVADLLAPYDHWLALGLLGLVGGKMLFEAVVRGRPEQAVDTGNWHVLLLLAVATSIDALAVGLSLSFLDVPVVAPAAVIGAITATISFAGVYCGRVVGLRLNRAAGITGGLILLAIGANIVLEHIRSGI